VFLSLGHRTSSNEDKVRNKSDSDDKAVQQPSLLSAAPGIGASLPLQSVTTGFLDFDTFVIHWVALMLVPNRPEHNQLLSSIHSLAVSTIGSLNFVSRWRIPHTVYWNY
jgi:hypothetical protein